MKFSRVLMSSCERRMNAKFLQHDPHPLHTCIDETSCRFFKLQKNLFSLRYREVHRSEQRARWHEWLRMLQAESKKIRHPVEMQPAFNRLADSVISQSLKQIAVILGVHGALSKLIENTKHAEKTIVFSSRKHRYIQRTERATNNDSGRIATVPTPCGRSFLEEQNEKSFGFFGFTIQWQRVN